MKIHKNLALCTALFLLAGCFPSYRPENKGAQKIVFTVLFGQSNSDPGLEDMLTEKINRESPNVTLEWESVDWGEYFSQEMQAKIASGEVPDMIIGKAQDVTAYQPSGFLAPFENNEYAVIQNDAMDSVTVNGKVYGLPYNAFYQGVLYNKNIFWRYGLEVPKTTEEMDRVIRRLEEVGITPFAAHFRENWYVGNITMQFAINQVFPQYPEWGREFRSGLRSFAESKEYRECFRQVKIIRDHTWTDAASVNQHESAKRFANEEAAMYLTGTWAIQSLYSIRPKIEIGIFPYPNETGDARLIYEPNLTFMKNAGSPNLKLAGEIIDAIFRDTELARTICAFTQTTPLIEGIKAESIHRIEDDIDAYKSTGRIVDVTRGNRQILWKFQAACAAQINGWLSGKIEFEDVLKFADDNRFDSGAASR
jgi:ABC-type glycerol-3-phosphate transport system substrate-binding protein